MMSVQRGTGMDSSLDSAARQLNTGNLLKLQAGGVQLAVVRGLVWITQEGDPRDLFLSAGGTLILDRRGIALVEAVKDTALVVSAPAESGRRLKKMSIALRRWAMAFLRHLGPTAVAQTVRPRRVSVFTL
jgi:outer membrane usher protein FimD/PapC